MPRHDNRRRRKKAARLRRLVRARGISGLMVKLSIKTDGFIKAIDEASASIERASLEFTKMLEGATVEPA